MLNKSFLKTWLHKDIGQLDKLLLILATHGMPCQIRDIFDWASATGFKIKKSSNLSQVLSRSKGLAIKTSEGWEITPDGMLHLKLIGIPIDAPAIQQVALDLRAELQNIKNETTRSFVEESIKCYELHLYRSAIVMSWLSAVQILQSYVHAHHLAEFNVEALRIDPKWKKAKTTDDLGRMGEYDFLDRLYGISVIGKNVKDELQGCLKRRNGCGHPNSLEIGPNTVAHHIEILLKNIFKKFA